MSLKLFLNCLRTKNYYFLSLGTDKTLSLGEFDKSKTHLILSPFFMNILRLNVQFKCQIMEYLPKFVFCRNLEKRS